MGNFSRNTFDQTKGYVGVRLQQGVPLVDADWNELNDVIRHELYTALSMSLPDGIPAPLSGLFFLFALPTNFEVVASYTRLFPLPPTVVLPPVDNDFYVFPGQALVNGRPLDVPSQSVEDAIRYSTQPWTDPTRAAEDGVDVIPLLTTPEADRTDLVYLDVWEREVDSTEDTDLINPVIGVETCVRLKREITIRVAEDSTTVPSAPDGHAFMPLALLNRPAGEAALTGTGVIQDIRPVLNGLKGVREISFAPAFVPITLFGTLPNWLFVAFPGGTGEPSGLSYAVKSASENASGILPLMIPQGARLLSLILRGYTRRSVAGSDGSPGVSIYLLRSNSSQSLFETDGTSIPNVETLLQQDITHTRTDTERSRFNRFVMIPSDRRQNIVDGDHYYSLLASSSDTDFEVTIQGISIQYQY